MKINKEITEDFIKEGKYFTTDELKNRIAKMDINELDYQQHDRKHYIEIYDRMILIKDNRDILSFYLKIDPLIFQKKSRRRSPIQITGENVKNEGKKAKKYDLDEEETNQIDLPNPNILQQLIPSTMNPKNDASPIIDLNTNIVRKNLNHKVESTFPKKPNDAIVVDNRRME